MFKHHLTGFCLQWQFNYEKQKIYFNSSLFIEKMLDFERYSWNPDTKSSDVSLMSFVNLLICSHEENRILKCINKFDLPKSGGLEHWNVRIKVRLGNKDKTKNARRQIVFVFNGPDNQQIWKFLISIQTAGINLTAPTYVLQLELHTEPSKARAGLTVM